jgi:predicted acyltransferase
MMTEGQAAAGATRLASLDVFRGLTIAAMLIVSNLGDSSRNYPLLLHAEWSALTPADLIFPFFLFIIGVALAMEFRAPAPTGTRDRHMRIVRRAGILFLLGLLLNAIPQFDPAIWRIPGVLQRIALCYLAASLICLHVPHSLQWGIGAGILAGYAAVLQFVGAPGLAPGRMEPLANLPRWVDIAVFSQAHLFTASPTDPEGLLSTPAAMVSVLLGCWVGRGLGRRPASLRQGMLLICLGFFCCICGWAWSSAIPMVKIIWTPTYVLFTGGWAMMCFGLCYLLTDVRPAAGWLWIVQAFGRNAILAYVLSELASDTISIAVIHGKPFSLLVADSIAGLCGGAVSPELGSLLYACLLTGAIWIICGLLYRRRWFIRV